MLQRLTTYDSIVGNKQLITKLRKDIQIGTLPNFIILYGNEGIGKTTLANLLAMDLLNPSQEEINRCIKENSLINGIQKYQMSTDSSLEQVKRIVEDIKSGISQTKVYILDEAQDMSKLCQDTLLTDLEYLTDKYVIMCTTDVQSLHRTIQSRAFVARMNDPTQSELHSLLVSEINRLNIHIESQELFLTLLITKLKRPRACLNVIHSIGENQRLQVSEFPIYVNYEDATKYYSLLLALEGSIHDGLKIIEDIEDMSQLILYVEACILSSRSSIYDKAQIAQIRSVVSEDKLIKFLYELTEPQRVINQTNHMIHSFIASNGRLKSTNTAADELEYSIKHGKDLEADGPSSITINNQNKIGNEQKVSSLQALLSSAIEF